MGVKETLEKILSNRYSVHRASSNARIIFNGRLFDIGLSNFDEFCGFLTSNFGRGKVKDE